MRINKLKFSNLNSLKGEFEIDFTDSKIIEDNIFAITGKTGSGKSTILDAITLALFAKTARIEKITGSSNEIMNRDSGSCYSEVIFTTSNKEYSALFSQRKARNKKDGNIIMYTRELRNYSDNKLIASNKTFDVELMSLINLTFDQFSRSVLLAQGDFNKFLIAKDDDKAKILEQITGTEIYSKIGMKVYSHHSLEKKNLEILDAQLESQNILTEAEKKNILDEITINSNKIAEVNEFRKTNTEELIYYSTKNNLDKKRLNLSSDFNKKNDNTPIYNSYLNKLELNKKAKQPLELLNKINLDSKSKDNLSNNINELEKELVSINEKIKLLKDDEYNSKAELKINEDSKSKTIEIIKQVRPIDKEINELSIKKEHLIDKINGLKVDFESLSTDSKNIAVKINSLKTSIKNSKEYLSSNIADKLLVDNFTEIVSNNNILKTSTNHKSNLENELKNLKLNLEDESKLQKELFINLDDTNNSIELIKTQHSSNKTQEELDVKIESLNERKSFLFRTSLTLETYIEDKKIQEEKTKELTKKSELYTISKKQLEEISTLYDKSDLALKRGKELLKLSSFASEIKDNVPCPLCGSIDHPHPINIEENQLISEESNVIELRKSLDICNLTVSSINSEIQILEDRITQLKISIKKNILILSETLSQVNSFEAAFNKSKTLNEKSILEVKEQLKSLEKIEKDTSILLAKKTTFDERLNFNNKNIDSLQNSIKDITNNIFVADDSIKSINEFFDAFRSFKSMNNKNLDEIKRNFTNHQNVVENKTIEVSSLKNQGIKVQSEIDSKIVTLKEVEKNLEDVGIQLNILNDNRSSIFGKKNCDDELNSINTLIKKNSNKLLSFTTQLNEEDKSKSIKLTRLKMNQDNYEILNNLLIASKEAFDTLLASNNFSCMDDLLSVKLENVDIKNYESFIKGYENLCERIKAIEDDIKKDENSLNKSKPKKSFDDCQADKKKLDNEYDLLQQSKGNLQEKLDTDSKNVSRIGKIKEEREKQYLKSENWAKLNAAIGSSDGKKFRGLAQGITLDFLLNNSNNKLSNLTDRYSLIRSNNSNVSTLDIDVIDLYMNGLTRSVNNLSGGEKFLVSLSLALGLCELVNSDNPSETLFLDEGFGTLDEDMLDNALNTLMILSEKENKLIGIISHVQKVKDAINHKIIIEKNGNGSSSITGAGVKQL